MLENTINRKRSEEFQNRFSHCLSASENFGREKTESLCVKTVTFQITEDCNLRCTYCYQGNKSKEVLKLEDAKKFIDSLIKDSYNKDSLINIYNTKALIVEFIGGEPLLETKLIREIINYFTFKCIEERHPWAIYHIFSMISNGVNYFANDTERLFADTEDKMSFSVSLDGNEELHDKCRVFEDGKGSYALAEKASKHYMSNYNKNMNTKMTLSPYNIDSTYDALINLFKLGYSYIHSNCVYEEGWTAEHGRIFYNELKRVSDFMLDNNFENTKGTSLFDEAKFSPMDSEDNDNYCGSTCYMMCLTPNGDITPCLRFAKSSLGDEIGSFAIGNIDNGICKTSEHKKNVDNLKSVTRKSQSTDECFNCSIATGCGWCTALNYQENGSIDKRLTHICIMHKALSLANVYHWNKVYEKNNENNVFEMHLSKEEALKIISLSEYEMLKELSKEV